jgi:hypothetical protein
MRYLASKALQTFSVNNHKHDSLLIHFPIESLINVNFSTQIFYSKILHFDLLANQIILLLDLGFLDDAES